LISRDKKRRTPKIRVIIIDIFALQKDIYSINGYAMPKSDQKYNPEEDITIKANKRISI
jgi:hypothetical protein